MTQIRSKKILFILALVISSLIPQQLVFADDFYTEQNILFYDKNAQSVCPTSTSGSIGTLPTNASVTTAISGADKYKALYQQVGTAKNVPWQMLAAIHYRETGYGTTNPSNGQGIFQFYSLVQQGYKFPPGPVTDAEFLRQLNLLADMLKGEKSQTPITDLKTKTLSATGTDPRKAKDVFFSYNGRASQYITQAQKLGYNPLTDPFEGSPYVMNLADSLRTPKLNPSGWGGFYADNLFGYYPQYNSSQAGAYVVYAGLGGGSASAAGGSCTSSAPSGNSIVDVARQELAKKIVEIPLRCDAGNPSTPGSCGPEIDKYTDTHLEYWCADFVSWVYKTAGVPFTGGVSGGWRQPAVSGLKDWFSNKSNGTYFSAKDGSKTPQPGDVIFFGTTTHTGIVYTVSGDNMTTIEGNTSTSYNNNGIAVASHTYNYRTDSWVSGFGRRN